MSEDFYDVLGVSRDADEDEIMAAYREKVSEYHPDVSDEPDAEETFKKIQKAKDVLTDDEKRQQYDQLGHDRFTEAEKRGGAGGGAGRGGMGGGNPFGGGGGGMGDIFDQFFGGGGQGGRGQSRPQQGRDLRTNLTVTLEEAYEGVSKQVTVRRPERCSDCGGKGYPDDADVRTCPQCDGQGVVTQVRQTPLGRVQQRQECSRCGGEGEIHSESCSTCNGQGQTRERATLTVDVPEGIRTGQTLRMDGEGAPGDRGARNGDLLVDVTVEEHPDFEREGDDLHHRHAVSFPQAVFGADIEVPTLDGAATFDLDAGTQSGETFRLEGKGMPRLRRRGHGDLYVTVQVVTPDSLNDEQRDALEAFAEAGGEEIDVEQGFFEKLKNSF
ncbi:molecular chaperone DnaJ [Halobacterium jilantaiense]|uniref:Chaperone protein DnaJ n=1 Tax=Halobacterium jilantaiense TaxID=355548 RepID=A0A1I0NPT4_9EURY|nr:molecular chaperone DnaJ [Halobacterium jilantaiense]SEW03443.1 molecular chaperone DnaJ [Halobacterium jilantaiense]